MRNRPRKTIDEPDVERAKAKDEGRQRQLYRSGNSFVVPVPPWVRALIGKRDGGSVYWHEFRPGEAILSAEPKRIGGHPSGDAAQRRLGRLTRENLLLKRRLRARPEKVFNAGASMGAAHVLRQSIPIEGDLAAIMERLDRIEDALARMPWARRGRRQRAAPDVERAPGPDTYASPVPSSSPDSIEQGAGTSGRSAPGAPLDE
jgi:hypothetical protein